MRRQQFAQKAFVVHNGTLLMVQKSAGDPHNPRRWEVPGGRMAFGEDVDEHLRREVLEETGVLVEPGEPFHIWQWIMRSTDQGGDEIQVIAVARTCTAASTEISTTGRSASDYLDGAEWVSLNEVGDMDLIPSLRPAVQRFLSLQP